MEGNKRAEPDLPPMPQCTYLVDDEAKRHGMHPAYTNLQNVMKYGGQGTFEQMFSAADMRAYARAALEAAGLERVGVIGTSAGGVLQQVYLQSNRMFDEPGRVVSNMTEPGPEPFLFKRLPVGTVLYAMPAASEAPAERSDLPEATVQDRYDSLARAGQFDQGDHPPAQRSDLMTEDAVHGRCSHWLRLFTFKNEREPYPQEIWDAAKGSGDDAKDAALTDAQIDAALEASDWPLSMLSSAIHAKLRQFARAIKGEST